MARYGDTLVGLSMEQPSIRRPVVVAWPAQEALDEPRRFVINLLRGTLATLPGGKLLDWSGSSQKSALSQRSAGS